MINPVDLSGRSGQAQVRPVVVEMLDVGPKDPFQVAAFLDQRPVQRLRPSGSHPPLGECVRVPGSACR